MAELTFNSPIRRDKWPRWMIKLHEYLKKIYTGPVENPAFEDYKRLVLIIGEKIRMLHEDVNPNGFLVVCLRRMPDDTFSVSIHRGGKILITYYLE